MSRQQRGVVRSNRVPRRALVVGDHQDLFTHGRGDAVERAEGTVIKSVSGHSREACGDDDYANEKR